MPSISTAKIQIAITNIIQQISDHNQTMAHKTKDKNIKNNPKTSNHGTKNSGCSPYG